ncbi:hypothetical protein KR074_012040 [Drosophila pseudoananassae]|nr:hypothetical protein KR074_012040 [Drosophila pseudoananassae]
MEAVDPPDVPNQENGRVVPDNPQATTATQAANNGIRFNCAEADPNANPNHNVYMVTVDNERNNFLNIRNVVVNLNMVTEDAMMAMVRQRGRHMETHPQADSRPTSSPLAPYICNLCAQYVRGGVITICGHLFCWACLWPKLHNSLHPKCPQCSNPLILHEDIIPFHGEGPHGQSDDDEVVAQPESVSRPSGMYLCEFPSWFRLNKHGDVAHLGLDTTNHRDFFSIPECFQEQHFQYLHFFSIPCLSKRFEVLKWCQIIFAGIMILCWFQYLLT